MRITVLGKSPAWQDVDGACSGYLVQAGPAQTTVLLDCGPGVFAKLRSHVDYVDVDAVVISHLHADTSSTSFRMRRACATAPIRRDRSCTHRPMRSRRSRECARRRT